MSADPSRIQAIRERREKTVTLSDFDELAEYAHRVEDDRNYLLAELESARSQAKEDAALMREAADRIEGDAALSQCSNDRETWHCLICAADSKDRQSHGHAQDCVVSRLCTAADRVEGE